MMKPDSRIYFNLHKRLFSVQQRTDRGWRVVEHSETVQLSDARFAISEAGRQRVLLEQRKNVHAYIYGYRIRGLDATVRSDVYEATYNPYKCSTFVLRENGEPVHTARLVRCTLRSTPSGIFAPRIECHQPNTKQMNILARDLLVGDTIMWEGHRPRTVKSINPYGTSNHSSLISFEDQEDHEDAYFVDKLTPMCLVPNTPT